MFNIDTTQLSVIISTLLGLQSLSKTVRDYRSEWVTFYYRNVSSTDTCVELPVVLHDHSSTELYAFLESDQNHKVILKVCSVRSSLRDLLCIHGV